MNKFNALRVLYIVVTLWELLFFAVSSFLSLISLLQFGNYGALLTFWRRPNDKLLLEIDEVIARYSLVEAGRCEEVGYPSRSAFVNHVILVKYRASVAMVSEDIRARNMWLNRISQLTKILQDLAASTFDSSLRPQPYGILIVGPPGAGKSTLAIRLAQTLCSSTGKPLSSAEMVILNESDDFQSEYRSDHRVVVFDDVAATRVEQDNVNPFRKVIDYINNIPKTALNPHLELKGNVRIMPEIVIVTMNQTWPIHHWNNCPEAITRRFKTTVVADRNRKFGAFDFQMVTKSLPFAGQTAGLVQTLDGEMLNNDLISQIPLTDDFQELATGIVYDYLRDVEEQEKFINEVNTGFVPTEPVSIWDTVTQRMFKSHQNKIIAQSGSEPTKRFRPYDDTLFLKDRALTLIDIIRLAWQNTDYPTWGSNDSALYDLVLETTFVHNPKRDRDARSSDFVTTHMKLCAACNELAVLLCQCTPMSNEMILALKNFFGEFALKKHIFSEEVLAWAAGTELHTYLVAHNLRAKNELPELTPEGMIINAQSGKEAIMRGLPPSDVVDNDDIGKPVLIPDPYYYILQRQRSRFDNPREPIHWLLQGYSSMDANIRARCSETGESMEEVLTDIAPIPNTVPLFPILFYSHPYKKGCMEIVWEDEKMCRRKCLDVIEFYSIFVNGKPNAFALCFYAGLAHSLQISSASLEIEPQLGTYTPDAMFQLGTTTVVVEIKSFCKSEKQIAMYMGEVLKERAGVIGITFTARRYNVFYLGKVEKRDLEDAVTTCETALWWLSFRCHSLKCEHFKYIIANPDYSPTTLMLEDDLPLDAFNAFQEAHQRESKNNSSRAVETSTVRSKQL